MTYNIYTISKYRSQIMGFAILWIMVFHFYKIINPNYLNFIISIGYGGVDIFLLMSGLGLYYSWQKNDNIKSFYKKRVFRLLPAFWIVVFCHDIITNSVSIATLSKLSTLGLWLPIPSTYWYISAMVAFYTLFPLYMKYYTIHKEKCLFVVFIIGFILTSIYTLFNHSDTHRFDVVFFLSRIPIFFLGITFGRLSFEKKELNSNTIGIISLLSIIAILVLLITQSLFTYTFLQNTALNNYPFIILAPAISLVLSYVLIHSPKCINTALSFLGMISLELYLVHLQFTGTLKHFFIDTSFIGCLLRLLVYLLLSVISSWILHAIVKKVLSLIRL